MFYCHSFSFVENLIKLLLNVFSHIFHILQQLTLSYASMIPILRPWSFSVISATGCNKRYKEIIPTINSNLMLEVVGSSQKIASFWLEPTISNIKLTMTSHSYKTSKFLKFLKIASFWLEPTTSNIKLTMTSHSYKTSKFLKFLKIASFWLEPTTSNIKLNMTSHSYKKLINSNLVRALTKILASLLA